jgi:chemotaxis protein MotA
MSQGTLLGFALGVGLFVGAIIMSTEHFVMFVSAPSLIMVLGGTMASAFVSYRARYVWLALAGLYKILRAPRAGREYLQEEVGQMIEWGYLVRRDGLIALEQVISGLDPRDAYLSQSISLVATGYKPDEVRAMCTDMAEAEFERGNVESTVLRYMGGSAPAFGMIGTLIGLVIMLDNLEGQPGHIGKGLAVALITTLYGTLLARLVFLPAANKILQNHQIMRFRNGLMTEGFVMLAEERSPRYIRDKMNCFLDPKIQYDISDRESDPDEK